MRKGNRGREKRMAERRERFRHALVVTGALSAPEAEILAEAMYGAPPEPPKQRPPTPSRAGGRSVSSSRRNRKKGN